MPPLPNKRQKLEAPDTPQTALSAVAALAARRQQAEVAAAASKAPATLSTNPFNALQKSQKRPEPNTPRGHKARDHASATELEAVAYSSFSLSENNHRIGENGVVELRLEANERFVVVGSFGLRILTGELTVAGATLRPSDDVHWVHAPHCHSVPVLRTTTESTSLELHSHTEAENLRKLGRLSPLFQKLWNDPGSEAVEGGLQRRRTYQLIGYSDHVPKEVIIQELLSPPEWNKTLASLVESARGREPLSVVVCGPKSAGKSTLSKLLTNRLLTLTEPEPTGPGQVAVTGVVVLDLDPGQSEYAPPGTVSLVHISRPNLGVPFTHPSLDDEAYKVVRCHSLASVNAASTIELHLECALDLYSFYRERLSSCPIIVNTPGWILSLGLEFLVQIIRKVRPAHVIYMSEDGPAESVEALRDATKNKFNLLPSQPSEYKLRTAAQFRQMQAMSYFHLWQQSGSDGVMRLSWMPYALSRVRPIIVPYSGRHRGFLGILRYENQLPKDLIADAINGMVLAIVEVEQFKAFRGLLQEDVSSPLDVADGIISDRLFSWSPEGIPIVPNPDDLTLDPRYSRTIGLALIRGVDTANESLQVLTPTPLVKINEAKSRGSSIVLVHGKFDTPDWSYTEHLYEQGGPDGERERELEITDEDTSDEDSMARPDVSCQTDDMTVPWVEVLKGSEKRPVGSRIWRVRRNLGRNSGKAGG